MRFIETPIFTRQVSRHLDDERYRALQLALLLRPEQGAVIPGVGGLRKLRWKLKGKGQRGGLRVLYYWDKPQDVIYMVFVYPKSEQEDLTRQQLKILARVVQEELK